MDDVDTEILAALERYEEDVLMVEVLLGQAAALKAGRPSLAEAVEEINNEAKDERTRRITEAGKQAEEAVTQELEALRAKQRRLQNEIEVIKEQDKADELESAQKMAKGEADHQAKKREEEEEFAALVQRYEREYPAMEKYLTPFISHGYTQPAGRTYRRTGTKGPVSYSRLVGAGVLGEPEKCLERFYYSTVTGSNDRELGAFPPHSFSGRHMERHHETILKVQTFLRVFGPVMVKQEKLAP
jgi:hypothetical protein